MHIQKPLRITKGTTSNRIGPFYYEYLSGICELVCKVYYFGFKSGIWLLIAPVPVHYFSSTFLMKFI